jgi:hypothetical protein
LLLGIHWYGYGNWEKIRLDSNLGLTTKIAPATLGERETFLPRAPNLDNRASALLQKVLSLPFSPPSCVHSSSVCAAYMQLHLLFVILYAKHACNFDC